MSIKGKGSLIFDFEKKLSNRMAGPAVIIGNPGSIFPRELASYWHSFGIDVAIVTRKWEGEKSLPDGVPILSSETYETQSLKGKLKFLQALFNEVEQEIHKTDPDRCARALGPFASDGYRPTFSGHLTDSISISHFVRSLHPQFVFGQEAFAYGLATALCFGYPKIIMPWGGDIYYFAETSSVAFSMVKYALNEVDLICPSSIVAAKHLLQRFGVPAEKVQTVSWGVNRKMFRRSDDQERRRICEKFGLDPKALTFMNVRRFKPPWGSDIALRAFVQIAHENPSYHFILLGGEGSEPFVREARDKVIHEGLADRFTLFEGNIALSDCAELMSVSDIYVSLMRSHDMRSSSILQAAQAGGAPILSHQDEYEEMLGEGFTAILVNPDNIESVLAALRQYARDPGLRRIVVARNQAYISKYEDQQKQMTKLLTLIASIDPLRMENRSYAKNMKNRSINPIEIIPRTSDQHAVWVELELNQ
jgi:glycosyltransferase involved in cell wall biosynthesis